MPDSAIEMSVAGLGTDPDSGATVLVLEGENEEQLAMVIGAAEATSIAKALGHLELERPLAHDLLLAVLRAAALELRRIEVLDLRDGIYFAELVLETRDGSVQRIDCRPSDAIAVALRADAPIFVREHIAGKERPAAQELPSPADKEGWKKLLEQMEPEDFGKYKM